MGQFWHLANTTSTLAPPRAGARVAPKTSKFASARWLASNLTDVPLRIKCQINNQKSRASPTQTWIALGKLVAMKNFAASLFCTAHDISRIISDPAGWQLSRSCDSCEAQYLAQSSDSCRAAFAVETWAHLLTSTAWKNSCGTLLLQLQQACSCD